MQLTPSNIWSFQVFPRNGGRACPEHMVQEIKCELRPCGKCNYMVNRGLSP